MRLISTSAAILLLLGTSVMPAAADDLGSVPLGLKFAEKSCAECHAIYYSDTLSPNPNSPPFKIVADTPGWTRTALNVFLQTPHKTMPNIYVTGADKDNVIAYILSLKGDGPDSSH
jgi:cytochrome c2